MSSELNMPAELIRDPDAVTVTGGAASLLGQGNESKNIAEVLLKESKNYTNDSQSKFQKAQQYLKTSKDLETMAKAVRDKARNLKSKAVKEEEKIRMFKEIIASFPQELTVFVPKNVSSDVLENIADDLITKAKEFRTKADDLLKDSEHSDKLAKQLREQSDLLSKKDQSISELQLKAATSQNEGLLLVLKKLGIAKLDAEYKGQLEGVNS